MRRLRRRTSSSFSLSCRLAACGQGGRQSVALKDSHVCTFELAFFPGLAAVAAPILFRKPLLLCLGAVYLAPFAVLEDDLVATRQNLKGLSHLVFMVEFG